MDDFEEDSGFERGAGFIKVRIASMTAGYNLTFNADGGGIIEYTEFKYSEKFKHKLNIGEVQAKYPEVRELRQYVTRYFWKEVNPTLRDPFLRDYGDLDMHELEFTKGKQAEFDRLMRLFILTEPDLDDAPEDTVMVEAASSRRAAKTSDGKQEPHLADWYYHSDRLEELVKILVKEHRPFGFTYEYNDNAYDRKSGYSLVPSHLEYDLEEISEAPAREKMAARQELRKWLEERGKNPADFDLDDWEKVQ